MANKRVGETRVNNVGLKMTIVEYKNNLDITVEFEDGFRSKATYYRFLKGQIKNPYNKSIYNVGCIGKGEYTTKNKKSYNCWLDMLKRCYDSKYQEKRPTYKDCIVHEDWHNYQNFAKWYEDNYYEIDGQRMALDKDILCKGNKIYSHNTCIFVPASINSLFVKSNSIRGDLPIGVSKIKGSNKYLSQIKLGRQTKNLGSFDTIEEAFKKYKSVKEEQIKEIATTYKDVIPKELYDAMLRYEIDIND